MFRILVADKLGLAGLRQLEEESDVTVDVKTGLSKTELCSLIPAYDALLVRSSTQVDADLLSVGEKLRVIGRAGMGVDNIDVAVATARGILVMNTPGVNSIATAEHTILLMLAAARHTAEAHQSVRRGEWRRSDFTGIQFYRKVLGLIGFGRIARHVAKRARTFDMEVIAFDPYVSEEVGQEMGILLVDLE